LSIRLFGPPGLLRHLEDCAARTATDKLGQPDPKLVLDLTNPSGQGQSLELLLQNLKKRRGSGESEEGLGSLAKSCPLLEKLADDNDPLPGMKVRINRSVNPLAVELWGLEGCLGQSTERANLLQLVNDLKSLKVAGKIGAIKIYLEFHTLERLLLKANSLGSSDDEGSRPSGLEFAAWSECLLDFRVELPYDMAKQADRCFLERETRYFPLLRKLTAVIRARIQAGRSRSVNERRWLNLRDSQKTPAEWATINAILLVAGAMYRYMWESCTKAEKLALYHLALHKRINPSNAEMLEQLALEGLITVHRSRIRIVNNSFAYFVRHAEDAQTLRELVEIGEAGPWRDYRLPVTLLILIGLAAVSLTSGSSIYVVVASALGLLGTLGTLTNSARLIQENLNR
jgi:hypothetical protein